MRPTARSRKAKWTIDASDLPPIAPHTHHRCTSDCHLQNHAASACFARSCTHERAPGGAYPHHLKTCACIATTCVPSHMPSIHATRPAISWVECAVMAAPATRAADLLHTDLMLYTDLLHVAKREAVLSHDPALASFQQRKLERSPAGRRSQRSEMARFWAKVPHESGSQHQDLISSCRRLEDSTSSAGCPGREVQRQADVERGPSVVASPSSSRLLLPDAACAPHSSPCHRETSLSVASEKERTLVPEQERLLCSRTNPCSLFCPA